MNSNTFLSPYTVLVVVIAMLAAVYVSTRPGDHSLIYTTIGGFLLLYTKGAYDSDQAKQKAAEAAEKAVVAVGKAKEAEDKAIVAVEKADIAAVKSEVNTQELAIIGGQVRVIGTRVDGLLDKLLESTRNESLAIGEKKGVDKEKADQALRNTPTAHVNPTPNQQSSVPTAANPLLTEDRARELLDKQTVIADKGEGWETPPLVQPDEIVRQKNRGETP